MAKKKIVLATDLIITTCRFFREDLDWFRAKAQEAGTKFQTELRLAVRRARQADSIEILDTKPRK